MGWNDLVKMMDRRITRHLDESTILYIPAGSGSSYPVDGVFDEAYVDLSGGEAGFAGARPVVFCRVEDLPEDPDQLDLGTMTINGVAYEIEHPRKDGEGGVRLFLHRAGTPLNPTVPAAPDVELVED